MNANITLAIDTWVAVHGNARDALNVALLHRSQAIRALQRAEQTCRNVATGDLPAGSPARIVLENEAINLRITLERLGVPND